MTEKIDTKTDINQKEKIGDDTIFRNHGCIKTYEVSGMNLNRQFVSFYFLNDCVPEHF